ncbi:hypothetical protein [Arthrobacter sp. L77]|uniref:hypothetical protein n=1 Tax=Arthrobacter sp. L77 TaxID=1496689 RepID=UPI0012DFF518|nr:hypothetical protein [Arthrobacter sp. L77]
MATTVNNPVVQARNRLACAARMHDHEGAARARLALTAAKLERAITEALAAGISDEDREGLARLLNGDAK